MEDSAIVDLYWDRSERAIEETDRKYGGLCRSIAANLLGTPEDAEECVSDTYLAAWNSMPEERPAKLMAWLGRVVRNISISRWRDLHREKRYSGMESLLSELEDCVPEKDNAFGAVEAEELRIIIDGWIRSLSKEDRALFLRRYWNGEAVADLAKERGAKPGSIAQRLFRLRQNLRKKLESEGVTV